MCKNATLQQLVQYLFTIQQEIQDAVDALQTFQYAGAAKVTQLMSTQKAMKKPLRTLQHEIARIQARLKRMNMRVVTMNLCSGLDLFGADILRISGIQHAGI
jgi:hypothetical protein